MTQSVVITTATATLAGALGLMYLYRKYWKIEKIPSTWTSIGKVTKLCIFPLKSGRRIEVDKAECLQRGFMEVEKYDKSVRLFDRCFVAYHEGNLEHRTARHHPKMVLIEVKAKDMNCVTFDAPNMPTLTLELPDKRHGKIVKIKHHKGEQIPSIDCGDEACQWISNYVLEKDCGLRLCYHDGTFGRPESELITKTSKIPYYDNGLTEWYTGLTTDFAAVFIINKRSVDDVAEKMDTDKVDIDYFRPNIVVDGPELVPYEENDWKWLKIGNVVMKNVGGCVRCVLTTVNMETGVRRMDREPLKILEKLSSHPNKLPIMGIYTKVLETGLISLGDIVYVSK